MMPLKYESPEFEEELKKRINTNIEYRERAKGVNWKILTIVDDVSFATYSNYEDGELIERKHISPSETAEIRKEADFVVETPTYDLSIEIATGKKSLESAFMNGMVRLEGSIFKALQYREALEMSQKIEADLVNESTIPSKEEFVETLKQRGLL
jgi:putative sterol carrier protein